MRSSENPKRAPNGGLDLTDPDHGSLILSALDGAKAEASIEAKAIGQRIRKLRLKRSMGLVELGKRTGLSASFLSQLETGRVVPTLRNLARICMVFGKDLAYFFREDNANCFRISEARKRVRLVRGDKEFPSVIAESLSSLVPDRSIVPCLAEFLPGPDVEPFHAQTSPGLELIYVIEGSLDISTGAGEQPLEVGDVAWIDANTKRQYRCKGDKPVKTMIVTFPGLSASSL
jgi:transcriptional regulator with XRE-family HTH domain